jgi:hypothetical protein
MNYIDGLNLSSLEIYYLALLYIFLSFTQYIHMVMKWHSYKGDTSIRHYLMGYNGFVILSLPFQLLGLTVIFGFWYSLISLIALHGFLIKFLQIPTNFLLDSIFYKNNSIPLAIFALLTWVLIFYSVYLFFS